MSNVRTVQAAAAEGYPDRLHARERGYPCSLVHALDAKQRLAHITRFLEQGCTMYHAPVHWERRSSASRYHRFVIDELLSESRLPGISRSGRILLAQDGRFHFHPRTVSAGCSARGDTLVFCSCTARILAVAFSRLVREGEGSAIWTDQREHRVCGICSESFPILQVRRIAIQLRGRSLPRDTQSMLSCGVRL